jgi:hypothetical protein
MKLVAVLALLLSAPAFAADVNPQELPENLTCYAALAKVPTVRKVKITKLTSGEPESSFRMGFQQMTEDQGQVSISFSDECEGWYAVAFSKSDLTALKAGSVERITGELEYDDLGEFFPGEPEENGHDKTPIVCKASKTGALQDRYN